MRAETAAKSVDTTELLNALVAFKDGDFSVRLPADRTGVGGKVYDALNEIFEQNEQMTEEFARISNAVGKEGRITQRMALPTATGGWAKRPYSAPVRNPLSCKRASASMVPP